MQRDEQVIHYIQLQEKLSTALGNGCAMGTKGTCWAPVCPGDSQGMAGKSPLVRCV